MRKHMAYLLSLSVIAAVVQATVAAGVSAAPPVVIDHSARSSDTFSDELCGITGTSATTFVGNFKLYADGTFLSTGNFEQVFTSDATDKQVRNSGVEQVTGPFNPMDNGDGTITETFVFQGMPTKLSIPHGPTLTLDAGSATVAITFVLNPDGSRGDFLSQVVVVQHGPHPLLDDGTLFCNVVIAALS